MSFEVLANFHFRIGVPMLYKSNFSHCLSAQVVWSF